MKVSVSQQHLAHGLGIVSRAVAPRSTLPVLGNILIATDGGRLRFSATNLEMGITCWVPTEISEEGSITVPARTISDLVATLPNDKVVLTLDQRSMTLNVRSGQSVTDIKGIDPQEFPPMPPVDPEDGIELNVADFKEMIQQVAFSASADEARPVLQGVLLSLTGSELVMAATDGFRISIKKSILSSSPGKTLNVIIPARALSELGRIVTDGSQTVSMLMPRDRGQVIFHTKDIELVSQIIDGNFPDFKAIVPRNFKTRTVTSAAGLLKACKQAEIIARESNNIIRLNILGNQDQVGTVEVSAQSEETGTNENKVDATVDGPGLAIAFNVRFLREVLEVVKSPNISLETNMNNTPGVIRPLGDENYIHVIMPMHMG